MARIEARETDDAEQHLIVRESDSHRRLIDRAGWGEFGPSEKYSSTQGDARSTSDAAAVEAESFQDPLEQREESAVASYQAGEQEAGETGRTHDFRRDVSRPFDLDEVSFLAAAESGRRMAHEFDTKSWPSDFPSRVHAVERFAAVTGGVLDASPCELRIEQGGTPGRDAGWSNESVLAVASWVVEVDDPELAVSVVAHEARHRWQMDVISGKLEHPQGDWARDNLILASETYDPTAQNKAEYYGNQIEQDARAFAQTAADAYKYESYLNRKREAGLTIAPIAVKAYDSRTEDEQ